MSAEERRPQILEAALKEFSHKGLHGGSTVTIAKAVDISHPNLFRLYPTKNELFIAVLKQAFDVVSREMLAKGAQAGKDAPQVMADVWCELMEDRELMLILLQGYSACFEPEIRELMESWTKDFYERMEIMPAVGTDLSHHLFAAGMLYMVSAAMDFPARAEPGTWIKRFLDAG